MTQEEFERLYDVLDDARYIPLVVLGTLSSTLSILGSSCILLMSFRKREKVQHRLLFALSAADMASSLALLAMPFAIPSFMGLPGAVGSHSTCTVTGFMLVWGDHSGSLMNAYISLYFYLVVVRNWREQDFKERKWQEIAGMAFAVLVPLTICLFAAFTQSINPYELANQVCTFSSWPWDCGDTEEDYTQCLRSNQPTISKIVLPSMIFSVGSTLLGLVCIFLVWFHVRKTRKRSASYHFEDGNAPSSARPKVRSDKVLWEVSTQAILYYLVFFNRLIWSGLGVIISNFAFTAAEVQEKKTNTGMYVFQVFYWILFPAQGAFNFLVYTRIAVAQWKKTDPTRSLCRIYQTLIFSDEEPTMSSGSMRSYGGRSSGKSSGVQSDPFLQQKVAAAAAAANAKQQPTPREVYEDDIIHSPSEQSFAAE